jgi:hypothetical protein
MHKDVAKEAFEQGTSISGIVAQALTVRRALKGLDPWKTIHEIQSANQDIPADVIEREVVRVVKAVRKSRRA